MYDFCGARIMTSEASHEEIDDKLIPATSNSPPNVNPTTAISAENTAQLKDKGNHQEIDDETPKTFPQTLMEILTSDDHTDIIAWLPHGQSFIIYKKKTFASIVLPIYFKASKFTSFTRKLNRWGFTRVTRGPEMGSYYHRSFSRDSPELCLRMSSNTGNAKYKYRQSHADAPHLNVQSHLITTGGIPFPYYGMAQTAMSGVGVLNSNISPSLPVQSAQQNQYINQQLQQLQWQQFQLQQFQQQQQQLQLQATHQSAYNTNNGGINSGGITNASDRKPDGQSHRSSQEGSVNEEWKQSQHQHEHHHSTPVHHPPNHSEQSASMPTNEQNNDR